MLVAIGIGTDLYSMHMSNHMKYLIFFLIFAPPSKVKNRQKCLFWPHGASLPKAEKTVTPLLHFHTALMGALGSILQEAKVRGLWVFASGFHGNPNVLKIVKMTIYAAVIRG